MILTITPKAKFSQNYNRINEPAIHAFDEEGYKTFCGIIPTSEWTMHQLAANYVQNTPNCKRCLATDRWAKL